MKIQKTTQPATFQPVVLEITIETQEEMEQLKMLFENSSGIYNVCVDQLDINADAVFLLENMLGTIGEAL